MEERICKFCGKSVDDDKRENICDECLKNMKKDDMMMDDDMGDDE